MAQRVGGTAQEPELPFYDGPLNAATYDAQMANAVEQTGTSGDVEHYVRLALGLQGDVLELTCGTGRITLPICQTGLSVVGLDQSARMLDVARAKAAALDSTIRAHLELVQGDMEDFDLKRQFALVLVPFHGFQGLLTSRGQVRCLRAIRRHLAPGGIAVIHVWDPNLPFLTEEAGAAATRTEQRVRNPITNREVLIARQRRRNDPLQQVRTEWWHLTEFSDHGDIVVKERSVLQLRWIYRFEMRHLFEVAGFEVLSEHSDFTGSGPAYARAQIWTVRVPSQVSGS